MERSKKKAGKIELMQNLPDDMIVEVLSRLPAKSLYRFRCVCKSWSALICPHFIRLNKNRHNLFLLFEQHYSIFDLYEATSDVVAANASMAKVQFPIFKDYSPIHMLTSCDGWLLLSVLKKKMQKLLLFSPFSGEHKVFPHYGDRFHHNQSYGICYDFSGNEYKVVCIMRCINRNGKPSFTVFSFKTNSWTRIRFLPDWIDEINTNWTVASHWTVNHRFEILCFDLKDEFKQVPRLPEEVFNCKFFMLGALRGNLCAWGFGLGLDTFLVMEMKQYGVKESWTQVCSINMLGNYSMNLLAFTKKGELVTLVDGKELAIYNVEDNSSQTIMRFKTVVHPSRMGIYADSSITLDCECWLNTKGRIS